MAFHGATVFAASETYLVWVHDGRLGVYDRGAGSIRELDDALPAPAPNGAVADLTVGRRLVAYASRPLEADPALTRAVVIDLGGTARVDLGAEAFVAGDRIAWREGDHYTVARTR